MSDAPTPNPAPVEGVPRVGAGLRRGLRALLFGAALLLSLVLGAAAWLLGSRAGLEAAIALGVRATDGALQVEGARGRLLGPLTIESLHYHGPDLRVDLRALDLAWQPRALLERRLLIDHLVIDRIDFAQRGPDAPSAPPVAPDSLQLPIAFELNRLELGRFAVREWAPDRDTSPQEVVVPSFGFSDLRAALGSDGLHHHLRALELKLPQGQVSFEARIESTQPFALAASGRFEGVIEDRALELRVKAAESLLAPRIEAEAIAAGLAAQAVVDVAPFDAMPVRALHLKAGELDPAAFVEGAPRAALVLEAELTAVLDNSRLLAGPVRVVNRSPAPVDQGGIPFVVLSGQLDWRSDSIGVNDLDIRLPGDGRIAGNLSWHPPATRDVAETSPSPAVVERFGQLVAALDLVGIDTRAVDARLPRQRLAGRIDAKANPQRQQAVLALTLGAAQIDAQAELQRPQAASGAEGETPLRELSLTARLRNIDPRALLPEAPQARLSLDVDTRGTLADTGLPQTLQLAFRIPDSRLEGLQLAGEGRLRLEGERLPDVAVALQLAGNALKAEGAWGAPGDVLELVLDAPRLEALGHGLAGRAGARGQVGGTLAAPTGELQFFGEALRLPGSIHVSGVNGIARLDAGADGPFLLSLGLSGLGPSGKDADGVALPDWLANVRMTASGTRARHDIRLELAAPERDSLSDTLELSLQGGLQTATARQPGPRWQGQLATLDTAGRFVAHLQAPATLELSPARVRLGTAELALGEKGHLSLLETAWSPRQSVARGSLTGLAFGLVSRPDGRPRRGPGPLVLGANWDVAMGETLDGEARVFRESGDLTVEGEIRTRLGLESLEAVLRARGDRLSLTAAARGTEFGTLQATASLRAQRSADGLWSVPPDSALSGSAVLDMPSITWLGRLMRENVETAGSLQGQVDLAGTLDAPLAAGRLAGRELQVALVDQGLILSGGTFEASFDRDRVRLERLTFVSPNRVRPREARIPFERLTATSGQFSASGEVLLENGRGDFRFSADRLPLLQRDDRWMILSGEGTAHSTWSSLRLDADFRADAGYIEFAETPAPSLSDDVVVLGRDTPTGGGFALTADVRVGLGEALYLSAMGLETRLAGELNLRLRPDTPLSAVGTISTVGGTYRGYGQRLAIDRGVVNFQGPLDAPGLNIVALRKGLAVEAGVAVTGSAKRPQVRLVSEPNVPDPEKLSWIVLGRAPDAASGADLGLLLPAAQALLGGPGGGMTDELSRSLGFDSFSIGQGELNSTSRTATSRVVGGGSTIASGPSVSGQVLSLGKRLGTDLFLSFEQSLGGAETLVKLSYQLSRRLSLVARGGTDNALDLYYSFSFR